MENKYGKIKNGKLIIASDIVLRGKKILLSDEIFFKENGYKKIVYVNPPNNKEGYILKSYWIEDSQAIIQKWEYEEIPDDYSGNLSSAVKMFDQGINEIQKMVRSNFNGNVKEKELLLKNNKLIDSLYKHKGANKDTKELLELLHDCNLDLKQFFNELKMISFLEENNFYISDLFLYYNEDKVIPVDSHITNDIREQLDLNKMILPQYFKSKLYYILELETYQTHSNITIYNMAFVYLFTLFDEVLLKIIRIICMHEKKWLVSNSHLTAAEILKYDSTDEIHELLVEKKVNELSWGNYMDKLDFLVSKGIRIDKENKKLFEETILYLSMKRNIIVHNEGMWNKSTKDILKNTQYYEDVSIGKSIDCSISSFEEACTNLKKAIKYLYFQICDKFNLLSKYDFLSEKEW